MMFRNERVVYLSSALLLIMTDLHLSLTHDALMGM